MKQPGPARTLGGILIIGGTAIGAGMLALPVSTAASGFYPSIFSFFLIYLFSMATGLLFLELCLRMPKNTNIISMARHYLGPVGQFFAWGLYLMLFYCLMVAYMDGGAGVIIFLSSGMIPRALSMLIFALIFGSFLFIGTSVVDGVNRLLVTGLIVAFVLFAISGFSEVKPSHFTSFNWKQSWMALPIIFTSFSYQGTLPSLMEYLHRNKRAMQYSIIIGVSLPFAIYILWQLLVMGIVPVQGEHGLLMAAHLGQTSIEPLRYFIGQSSIAIFGEVFGFCALGSSLLGVSLGFMDFLSDGLKVEKKGKGRVVLCVLIFLPAMLITLYNPGVFLLTLRYAGGIGCAILLGLYPALMVWRARYVLPNKHEAVLFGGKWMLALLMAFVAFELSLEFVRDFKVFAS